MSKSGERQNGHGNFSPENPSQQEKEACINKLWARVYDLVKGTDREQMLWTEVLNLVQPELAALAPYGYTESTFKYDLFVGESRYHFCIKSVEADLILYRPMYYR